MVMPESDFTQAAVVVIGTSAGRGGTSVCPSDVAQR